MSSLRGSNLIGNSLAGIGSSFTSSKVFESLKRESLDVTDSKEIRINTKKLKLNSGLQIVPGSAGKVLKSDASGNATWQDASAVAGIESSATSTVLTLTNSSSTFTTNVTAPTFTGDLVGNADSATVSTKALITQVSDDVTHHLTFVDGTGNRNVCIDTNLTYNPNTNVLTAPSVYPNDSAVTLGSIANPWNNAYINTVNGNLNGNATTATTATTALSATNGSSDMSILAADFFINATALQTGRLIFPSANTYTILTGVLYEVEVVLQGSFSTTVALGHMNVKYTCSNAPTVSNFFVETARRKIGTIPEKDLFTNFMGQSENNVYVKTTTSGGVEYNEDYAIKIYGVIQVSTDSTLNFSIQYTTNAGTDFIVKRGSKISIKKIVNAGTFA